MRGSNPLGPTKLLSSTPHRGVFVFPTPHADFSTGCFLLSPPGVYHGWYIATLHVLLTFHSLYANIRVWLINNRLKAEEKYLNLNVSTSGLNTTRLCKRSNVKSVIVQTERDNSADIDLKESPTRDSFFVLSTSILKSRLEMTRVSLHLFHTSSLTRLYSLFGCNIKLNQIPLKE